MRNLLRTSSGSSVTTGERGGRGDVCSTDDNGSVSSVSKQPTSQSTPRRSFKFLRAASSGKRDTEALEKSRQHARMLALAASSEDDPPSSHDNATSKASRHQAHKNMVSSSPARPPRPSGGGGLEAHMRRLDQHHPSLGARDTADDAGSVASFGSSASSAYDMGELPQVSSKKKKKKSKKASKLTLDAFVSNQQSAIPNLFPSSQPRSQKPPVAQSVVSDPGWRHSMNPRTNHGTTTSTSTTTPRKKSTLPSNSSMTAAFLNQNNHVSGSRSVATTGSGGAAARRRMRSSHNTSGSSVGSVASLDDGSVNGSIVTDYQSLDEDFSSFEPTFPIQKQQQQQQQQQPRQGMPPTWNTPQKQQIRPLGMADSPMRRLSTGKPTRRNSFSEPKKPPMSPAHSNPTNTMDITDGFGDDFTFDAFGLDAKEIDNEVNAAIEELRGTHPDFEDFFVEGHTTTGHSRSISTRTTDVETLFDDSQSSSQPWGLDHDVNVHGRFPHADTIGPLAINPMISLERDHSDSSSLTSSTGTDRGANGGVNVFKEQAGFHSNHNKRRVIRPVTTRSQEIDTGRSTHDFPILSSPHHHGHDELNVSPMSQSPSFKSQSQLQIKPHYNNDTDQDDELPGQIERWQPFGRSRLTPTGKPPSASPVVSPSFAPSPRPMSSRLTPPNLSQNNNNNRPTTPFSPTAGASPREQAEAAEAYGITGLGEGHAITKGTMAGLTLASAMTRQRALADSAADNYAASGGNYAASDIGGYTARSTVGAGSSQEWPPSSRYAASDVGVVPPQWEAYEGTMAPSDVGVSSDVNFSSDVGIRSDVGVSSDIGIDSVYVSSPHTHHGSNHDELIMDRPQVIYSSPRKPSHDRSPTVHQRTLSSSPPPPPPNAVAASPAHGAVATRDPSPLGQERIQWLRNELGDQIRSPEWVAKNGVPKKKLAVVPTKDDESLSQIRAKECGGQRSSFSSAKSRLRLPRSTAALEAMVGSSEKPNMPVEPARHELDAVRSRLKKSSDPRGSMESVPSNDLSTTSQPSFLSSVKLRNTGGIHKLIDPQISPPRSAQVESRFEDDEPLEDMPKHRYGSPPKARPPPKRTTQDDHHHSAPQGQEQKKLTYREQQELLKQQEQEAEEYAEAKTAERDVATLIRRRIAANRRNLSDKPDEPDEEQGPGAITSVRSRLRKVTREPKESQGYDAQEYDAQEYEQHHSIDEEQYQMSQYDRYKNPAHEMPEEKSDKENATIRVSSARERVEEHPVERYSSSPPRAPLSIADQKSKPMVAPNPSESKIFESFQHQESSQSERGLGKIASLFGGRSGSKSKTEPVDSDAASAAVLKRRKQQKKQKGQSQHEGIKEPSTFDTDMGSVASSDGRLALKDDPKYAKYFKMLKVGMPVEVVQHAMTRDEVDPSVMDGDHNKPASVSGGVPLKEDPKYVKYFKMMKMGLPMPAVKHAMERDGIDSIVMDGDHNAPAPDVGAASQNTGSSKNKPKDTHRRTRLHWDTLRKVTSKSVWALVGNDPDMEDIEIDESEFAELFQAELKPTEQAKVGPKADASKKGGAVKVIDPKRANNGGIILARLKMSYDDMAQAVDTIDGTAMTTEQVQGIVEYIPTQAEQKDLKAYMSAPGLDVASKFEALCECEKFMVAMMTVKHSKNKIRALLFKLQFESCMKDLMSDTTTVEKSCDELSNSIRLRKLLGIVLNIGNRLNTAGPSQKGKAGAFTLDSLLKLNQAKAFDKKTTFLHYVVLVVQRNNELLVRFKDDLPTVMKAEKVYWDQCLNDLEEVENQLENIRKISLHQANDFSKGGKRNVGDDDDSLSDISISLEDEVRALRSSAVGIFTLDAIKKVSALREKVETTQTKFAKVLEYFGEEEKINVMQPHELFQIIATFCKNFDTAREEVAANTKLKLREERKRQARNGNTKVQGTRIYPSDNAVETMKSRSQDSELNPSRSFQSCASIDSTKNRVFSAQPNRSFARNGLEVNGSNSYSNPAARRDPPIAPDPVWKAKSANTRVSQSSGNHEAQPAPSFRSKLPDPEPSVSSRQYERQSHAPPQPSYSQTKMKTKNSWQTQNRETPGRPDPEPTKVSSYQPSPTQRQPQYSQPSYSQQNNEPRVNSYPVRQNQQQQPTESLLHSRREKEISIQTSQVRGDEPAHSQSTTSKSSSTSGISPDEKLRQKARMRRRMGQGTLSPTSGPASPPVPSSSSPLTKTTTPGSVSSQARARQRRRDRLSQIKSSNSQTSPRASSTIVDWPVQSGN